MRKNLYFENKKYNKQITVAKIQELNSIIIALLLS